MSIQADTKNAARDAGQDLTFTEILAKVEAKETALRDAALATLPPRPTVPKLVEEPSAVLVTYTGMGGNWQRRRFASGTVSAPAFMGRGLAGPRYSNQAEVDAAREGETRWLATRAEALRSAKLLSGHALGLLNGTARRSGGYSDFGPKTLSTLEEKAKGNSWTACYCQEILNAIQLVHLADCEG